MRVVLTCRHGEAYKNLKNIYGGKGSALTDEGIKQVEAMSEKIYELVSYLGLPTRIFRSCDRIHVVESSDILRNRLGLSEVEKDPGFTPIRLGVFDGMSKEKQEELYPEARKALEMWQNGLIDIKESEVKREGAQSALEYYNQMKDFVDRLPDNGIYVLFGTRSDALCMLNVFKGQSPAVDMAYKHYDFGYAQAQVLLEKNGVSKVQDLDEIVGIIHEINDGIRLKPSNEEDFDF